ncbi:TonB-dependent receptor [Sediminibacterium sp.]|uniref:SusC/RagA family TonB-linked outer membrane protein n=1 Tax=Sediminibacterium sp. TaxID=1917865 RepID=UPI0025CC3506|nr:TonB-dependent receptor [Sediminibacterium sp.]
MNQTGSTQTVKFDDAVNQPVTNSGQLMYGKFSGVQITQGSGLPGADASSVLIRGLGTFGNSNPLVVIDNIQFSGLNEFNNLSPADIESISVLKDASASSIYGARGANGVIIVTTKKGKSGSSSVVYNSYVGFQKATVIPKYLGAVDYATLINERDINQTGPTTNLRYSPADIQAIIDGSNKDQFSNTNWANEILRNAPIQSHYIAFSGGNEKTTYRVSLGYLGQEAIVKGKFKTDRFTLSFNLNSKVKEWLSISNVTNAYWSKFKGPTGGADAITGETGIINQFQRSHPVVPAFYSNGEYGFVDGTYLKVNAGPPITNPLRRGVLGDYSDDEINIATRFGVKADLTKYLSFETSGSISAQFGSTSNFTPTSDVRDWAGNIVSQNLVNSLRNSTRFNYRLLNENILRYAKKFDGNKHDLGVLVGHSLVYNRNDGFTGNLEGFPTNNLQEFNGGGVLNPNVSGGASVETLQSFFARVNYIYNGKYLFEANVRRDGSSKFGPANKYGTFPSLSAGWRISEEKFLRDVTWLSELKLRGSWGITGNDNIGNNLYSQNYSLSGDYFIGNTIVSTVTLAGGLANPRIRWEKVEQLDVAVDAGFFGNKLQVTAGYFNRKSSDLLYSNYPIPATIGISSLGAQNAADMVNSGTEFSLNYRNSVRKLNYTLGANLSLFADNKVTGLGQGGLQTIGAETIFRVGDPFNALYGYKVLGIFQSTNEVATSPRQFGNTRTAPGDFKYADLNGDGVINESDRTVIGNPFPKTVYNFNATLDYKGIDLVLTFEGVGRLDRIMNDNGQRVMEDSRNNVLSYLINRWTPTNPSTIYPRAGGQNNAVVSTFFVEDVSYTRLRNLEIGYTLPNSITSKFGVSKLRVYVGGQNLLTFTKFKNFDPERQRGGNSDQNTPLYKVYTFGLNVKF